MPARGNSGPLALLRWARQACPVYGVLAALLTLAPASAAPERADSVTDPGADECRDRELDFFVGYGSPDAPKLLRVYIDPVEPFQLQIWLEARRIVGERDEELRMELIPTRGGRAEGDAPFGRRRSR